MKVVRLLALPAVAALPQLALAATPPGELGALQAVYDFCAKADPAHANDFQGKSAGLFEGMRQPVVVQIKNSGEYERGYNMLARVLQGLPNDQAATGCAAITRQLTGRTHGSVVRKPVQPAPAASHRAEAHQPATPVKFGPAASHPAEAHQPATPVRLAPAASHSAETHQPATPVQPALAASHSAETHQPATPVFAPAASHPAAEGAALDLGTSKEER